MKAIILREFGGPEMSQLEDVLVPRVAATDVLIKVTACGVISFTRALAREVAHRGVTVNAVAPGSIMTEMTRPVFEGPLGAGVPRQIPMHRFGEPDDIAGRVAFLASHEARYLTGQVAGIDGGVV